MKLAKRVSNIRHSVTQKINEEVIQLIEAGEFVYNLTSGQLPFHPPAPFIKSISQELKFLNSFQYSPVSGHKNLKNKLIASFVNARGLENFQGECIVSNGAKQVLYNSLGALVEEGDEIILIAPYWVSFSEMIKFWRGSPRVVNSKSYDNYTPNIDDIKNAINDKTKVLIINSPNNPTGVAYSDSWMKEIGKLLIEYPNLFIISDEIYSELSYYDPKPSFFYQYYPELLTRTIIVNGISKSFASTGLRIGYAFADHEIIKAMELIQSQTTSGASSLIQLALTNVAFDENKEFLEEVLERLRRNASFLREKLRETHLSHCWYQSTGAFYFLFNFSSTNYFKERYQDKTEDFSQEICDDLFKTKRVALVPGGSFGAPNTGRLSLAFDELLFQEAVTHIIDFCHQA